MKNDPALLNRRKILIIDKEFQNKFITRFFVMVAIGSIVTGAIVYLFCGHSLTTVFRDSRLKIMSTTDFILPGLVLSAVIVILVVGMATAFMALYVSHRIAGPVYRMRQDLSNFHGGKLGQTFHLRGKDEMKPLARELNEMARKIQQDVAVLKAEVDALDKYARDFSPRSKDRVGNMKKILDRYHV